MRRVNLPDPIQVRNPVTKAVMTTQDLDAKNKVIIVNEDPWTGETWLAFFVFGTRGWGKGYKKDRIARRVLVAAESSEGSLDLPDDQWRAVRDFLEREGNDPKDDFPLGYAPDFPHGVQLVDFVDAWLNASEVPE